LVVCEIFVVPMIFGFWQIAAIWGLLNIGILAFRIHEEDLALRERRETAS
jgi:isoprenylcysteine carboxyl methyltransferase (ICMT) family protein YpbQ